MDEQIWYTFESDHESWHLMNTGMIKEVSYVDCHQYRRYSTQTAMSTCIITWVKVSRLNMMVHHLIIGHWCIPLTDARYPTDNDNGNQGTEWNLTSVNRCVEVDQWTLMYSQNYRWRENLPLMTISLKELKWTLDSYSKINYLNSMEWNALEGGH